MQAADIAALSRIVLAATFALAFVFGAIVQRTGFCTMGGLADVVSYGDWTRLRQWLLAMAVAIFGTTLLDVAGLIDVGKSFYTTPRFTPVAYAAGGVLFGFGMVLAGGCASKSLVRAGGGSLKSLVALLVLAVVAYMTLRGALALVRVGLIERLAVTLPTRQDLPSLLAHTEAARTAWRLGLGLAISALLAAVALRERSFRTFDNLLAGAGIGAIVVAVWFVSGYVGHVAEHPQTLEEAFLRTNSRQMESLSFVAPVAWTLDYLLFTSDASKELTIGIVAVVGMLLGAMASALARGQFRWEGFRDAEDTGNHLVGGALMGFGGVTALGCTIGQGLSGLSTLAAGSFIALAGIVVGGVLGVHYQGWRAERMAG
ncbi:MAG TPA: YeeE/YedE family protein [Burkholderiaceae bacterium]|nr:YeeE/YedE family protein [Burkholderiaceae bacterium]